MGERMVGLVRVARRDWFDPAKPRQYPRTVARKSAIRLRSELVRSGPAPVTSETQSLPKAIVSGRSSCVAGSDAAGNEERAVAKGKRTFQPNNRRRARVHGFRLRMRTRAGRAIVSSRRRKGRRSLTA